MELITFIYKLNLQPETLSFWDNYRKPCSVLGRAQCSHNSPINEQRIDYYIKNDHLDFKSLSKHQILIQEHYYNFLYETLILLVGKAAILQSIALPVTLSCLSKAHPSWMRDAMTSVFPTTAARCNAVWSPCKKKQIFNPDHCHLILTMQTHSTHIHAGCIINTYAV